MTRCFAWTPERRDDALFEAAAAELEALLPGPEPLADRLAAWDARFEIPVDRLPGVVEWLVGRFRARAAGLFGLPSGRGPQGQPRDEPAVVRLQLVRRRHAARGSTSTPTCPSGAPTSSTRSPTRRSPGHHLEHAWKEADLVDRLGQLEASILLINTPECLISEGLADLGYGFASPIDEEADLLVELYDRAGLPIAADPAGARDAAQRTVAMRGSAAATGGGPRQRRADAPRRRRLARGDLRLLVEVGRRRPHLVEKRLEFIEHPLWRTYVFVYDEGEALLRRWLEAVPEAERPARFGRLLHEQLTPTAIAAELAAARPEPEQ